MGRVADRGAALLLAIAALAGLGAFSVTGYALARAERQAGQGALARIQARGAAEAAIAAALDGWPAGRTPAAPGEESPLASLTAPGPTVGTASLRSLGGVVYAVRGVGVRRDLSGTAIGFAELELLVLLDSLGPDSVVRPRPYPRGWRILP